MITKNFIRNAQIRHRVLVYFAHNFSELFQDFFTLIPRFVKVLIAQLRNFRDRKPIKIMQTDQLKLFVGKLFQSVPKRFQHFGTLVLFLGASQSRRLVEQRMSKSVVEKLSERYGDKLFLTKISKSVEAANSSERMKALTFGKSKLGEEYKQLGAEVAERCGK